MEVTWQNFWHSPVAVATFLAAISGILIALGLELRRSFQIRRERNLQAKVIFAVLIPPLGEISAAAERALNDPRINDTDAFVRALRDQDPTFALPIPAVMLQVFDRLHFLPSPVAVALSSLYSDLTGWQRLYANCANAVAIDVNVAEAMPSIYHRVNETVSKIARAARKAKLPVEGLEDID